jgi:serine/threonine-protein kinase
VTRTGQILGERYRLDKRIAAGGVGQVWQAADLLLGRPVAVKVLRPEYADHPETLDRFRKEARHTGALSHPHVAQVYDYGPAGPDWPPYLVMEFVDGPSLADLLVVDPVEAGFALDVVAQAADGLSAAHRAGLVHRDVKPGNLLIGPDGQVKVTDFGIASAAGQAPVTGPNLVMGTTQYMAPERISGGPGTPASDLYALGIVLHECLTGIPPFEGSPADVMAAHLYLPIPPLPAGVPPELDALVARLTAKDPAQRMSDARELAVLAGGLRDALAAGRLVAPARAAALSGAGGAADEADEADRGDVPGANDRPPPDGAAPPGASGPGQLAQTGAGQPSGAGTAPLPVAAEAQVSDEWTVPAHMSVPASPADPADGRQARRRRRAGAVAVLAAVLAGAALVVLLVAGALRESPDANQVPASPVSTGAPAAEGGHPTHAVSQVSRPAGSGASTPGAAPSVTSPGATASRSPSAGRSAKPSASSSGSRRPTSSQSPTSSPSASVSPFPSESPSSSPSESPSTSPSASPSSVTPPPTICVGPVCL